jgi:hypothetical protein
MDFLQALSDPSALPFGWPTGGLGAFLLFLAPVGGGIPVGVLLADRGGVPAWGTILLYLLSDVVLAFAIEPLFAVVLRLGRRFETVGRAGAVIQRVSHGAGLKQEGAKSALGLIFVSFAVSPTTGRAAAASVGHGFFRGWSLAIIGDMAYFALLMASTLWLSNVLGNDRLTIVIAIATAWILPLVLQRMRTTILRPAAVAAHAEP